MKQNILITGFMGAGKSSVARAMAELTGLFEVDTDDLIESLLHCSIKSYFVSHGENAFRRLEQRLANWLASSVDHTIVATGGGFYQVQGLMELGQVCFLNADFDTICRHLHVCAGDQQTMMRPLFQNLEAAKKRFDERLPLYRQNAHHIITVGTQDSMALARQIQDILRQNGLLAQ